MKKGTRAGTSPNREGLKAPLSKACFRPCEMMAISAKGTVSVCSEDFYSTINMGNIAETSLKAIWDSDVWQNLRSRLLEGDRSATDTCAQCDYKGFTYEMLMEHGVYEQPTVSWKEMFRKVVGK